MQAPAITTALAGIRRDERILAAASARRLQRPHAGAAADVTIRLARPADEAALGRLAQLDGRGGAPAGEVVVAVVAGAIVAARGLGGGVVSDPFRAGPEIVALLDVRARQLGGARAELPRTRAVRRTMPVLRVGGAR